MISFAISLFGRGCVALHEAPNHFHIHNGAEFHYYGGRPMAMLHPMLPAPMPRGVWHHPDHSPCDITAMECHHFHPEGVPHDIAHEWAKMNRKLHEIRIYHNEDESVCELEPHECHHYHLIPHDDEEREDETNTHDHGDTPFLGRRLTSLVYSPRYPVIMAPPMHGVYGGSFGRKMYNPYGYPYGYPNMGMGMGMGMPYGGYF